MSKAMDTPRCSSDRRTRPNPDKLPEDYAIDWLHEAKQAYESELPPFVERNHGSNKAGNRQSVILRATNGQEQRLPVEGEIICWSWSHHWSFKTIDIGGRRLIVKGDSPDHQTCSYRRWEGPKTGFSFHPVAFGPSQIQYAPQPEWRRPSFSPINQPRPPACPVNPNPEYPGRQPNTQMKPRYSHTESIAQPASPSIAVSPRPTPARDGDVQITTAPVHHSNQRLAQAKSEREPSKGLRQNLLSPKIRENPLKHPCDSDQASPSRRPSNETSKSEEANGHPSTFKDNSATEPQTAHQPSAEPADEKSTSQKPREPREDVPLTQKPQPQEPTATDPTLLARTNKRKRQPSTSDPTSPHLSTATRTTHSTRSSPQPTPSSTTNPSRLSTPLTTTSLPPTQTHPPSSSSTPFLLPPYKQSRTTLFVAIPLSSDTVPLKLRSCMSLSSFFKSVLAVSAQKEEGDVVVSGIRATFEWKKVGDVERSILLKREVEDTWEVFLEIVEGAPCWEKGEGGGGRCGVGVEVVLV